MLDLAQGDYIEKKEKLILMGNSGTRKTHLAVALGIFSCQNGKNVRFYTAAGLINQLMECQAALKLSQPERTLSRMDLLIIDEVGYVPISEKGSQLFFQIVATSYERQSLIMTTNPEFSKWLEIFGGEQLTGALLDREWGWHEFHIFPASWGYRLHYIWPLSALTCNWSKALQ